MTETPQPQLPAEPDEPPAPEEEGDDRAVEGDDAGDRWRSSDQDPDEDLRRRRANVEQLLRGDPRWRS